jgi:hypothetical protein
MHQYAYTFVRNVRRKERKKESTFSLICQRKDKNKVIPAKYDVLPAVF